MEYFSAQSHTNAVAEKITSNLVADIFEIVPEETYTSAGLDRNDSEELILLSIKQAITISNLILRFMNHPQQEKKQHYLFI